VFRYSIIGPAIAARVAEVVMKKKFDLLVQQKLFRPLGMRQTTFTTIDASAINAATGARTTANDYIRFLRMLLNNGLGNGQKILSEQAIKELRTISTIAGAVKGVPEEGNHFGFAAGAWAPEQKANEATVLVGPGLAGTLAIVDFCRGYAFLILVKKETDTKANIYTAIKNVLDEQFNTACK
jgi:CubicO group peptidase (beta-lactamase class C family)